jgi:hypothetical protein
MHNARPALKVEARQRTGIDLNSGEIVECYLAKVQNRGAYRLCMAYYGNTVIFMRFRQRENAAYDASLQFVHAFSARWLNGPAMAIPFLPMRIVLQLIECTTSPITEVEFVELWHDHNRSTDFARKRSSGLQCAQSRTRFDIGHPLSRQADGKRARSLNSVLAQ